jgi:hypothetical protein
MSNNEQTNYQNACDFLSMLTAGAIIGVLIFAAIVWFNSEEPNLTETEIRFYEN